MSYPLVVGFFYAAAGLHFFLEGVSQIVVALLQPPFIVIGVPDKDWGGATEEDCDEEDEIEPVEGESKESIRRTEE